MQDLNLKMIVKNLLAFCPKIATILPFGCKKENFIQIESVYAINTSMITNSQGVGNPAEKLYTNCNSVGYLPSRREKEILCEYAIVISHKSDSDGNAATSPLQSLAFYRSSTQFDNQFAYMYYFVRRVVYTDFRSISHQVRAVIRF
jgi:hypothetical protein